MVWSLGRCSIHMNFLRSSLTNEQKMTSFFPFSISLCLYFSLFVKRDLRFCQTVMPLRANINYVTALCIPILKLNYTHQIWFGFVDIHCLQQNREFHVKTKIEFSKKTKNNKKNTDFLVALSLQQLFFFHFCFSIWFYFSSFSSFVSFAFTLWRSMGVLFVYIFWILHNFFLPSNFQPLLAQRKNVKCELRMKKVHFSWHWIEPFVLIIRHASHKESENANENIFRCFKCAEACLWWNFNALQTCKKIRKRIQEKPKNEQDLCA